MYNIQHACWRLLAAHGDPTCGTELCVTRVWGTIGAPAWLLIASSPAPQLRRPLLPASWEAGGAVGSAWAGSIRRRWRPRHQASRAKAARETRGRGRPAAAVAAGPLHAGLVVSRTHSQGLGRQANKASALASGKCSCLWLRACSLAQQRGPLLVLSGVFRRRSAMRSEDAG